ncbi:MAG: protein phosphatase 2C domain-containing protein [Gemmatimonadaceae bacterium]
MTQSGASDVVLDAFGASDRGLVRDTNEDHFVIASIRKSVDVRQTSVPDAAITGHFGASSANLFAVADGVGGKAGGELASESTVSSLLEYLGRAAGCFHGLDASQEMELIDRLEESVRIAHERLLNEFGDAGSAPATTLTMVMLAWPRAYFVHVGDSRAYVMRKDRLQRLTRDQTLGEYMVSAGAWTAEQAARPGPANTLTSAIGGPEVSPSVGLIDLAPGDAILLCTDGLTRHVSDERIAEVLRARPGAEATCRQLIQEALSGGGADNVTVLSVFAGNPAASA